MAPKKAKKRIDDRGYATTSVSSSSRVQSVKVEDIDEAQPPILVEMPSPKPIESSQALEHQRHVDIEIQRSSSRSSYSLRLLPQVKIEVQQHFAITPRDFFLKIQLFTKSLHSIPTFWSLSVWSYERVSKIVGTLEGIGLPFELSCEAVYATRGYDERAAVEWIIENFPEKTPLGWCETQSISSSDESLNVNKTEHDELFARAQQANITQSQILSQAKSLVAEINRDIDTNMMTTSVSNVDNTLQLSPTSRYAKLKPLQFSLQDAYRVLPTKKERNIIMTKLKSVRNEMAQLKPNVDFDRIKDGHVVPKSDLMLSDANTHTPHLTINALQAQSVDKRNASVSSLHEQSSFIPGNIAPIDDCEEMQLDVTPMSLLESIDVKTNNDSKIFGGIGAESIGEAEKSLLTSYNNVNIENLKDDGHMNIDSHSGHTNTSTNTYNDNDKKDSISKDASTYDVNGDMDYLNIFDVDTNMDHTNDCQTTIEIATAITSIITNSSGIASDTKELPFEYIKSKSHLSPLKLLVSMITEIPRFVTVPSKAGGANEYLETIEIGPICGITARKCNRVKASIICITPKRFSMNQSSAKELTCLRFLFETIPKTGRQMLSLKFAPCALQEWNKWIAEEETTNISEAEEQANKRAYAIEKLLDAPFSSRNKKLGESEHDVIEQYIPRKLVSTGVLLSEMEYRTNNDTLNKLEDTRKNLPANMLSVGLMQMIARNEILIICGETGCGKSTQIPQLILRDFYEQSLFSSYDSNEFLNIIVTEPRRVAAISVSSRVNAELGDGPLSSALCGYTVRLDSRVGPKCCIEYVTIGVLLKRIQLSKGACLEHYSHIVVDEVHERSVDSDYLLLLLREYRIKKFGLRGTKKHKDNTEEDMEDVLEEDKTTEQNNLPSTAMPDNKLPIAKLILMSATADTDFLMSYWQEVTPSISVMKIPGRTFPIESFFLEDIIEESGYVPENRSTSHGTEQEDGNVDAAFVYTEDAVYSARTVSAVKHLDLSVVNYDLIFHVIKHELKRDVKHNRNKGAILVFLPGLDEIHRIIAMINDDVDVSHRCVPIAMHSSLSANDLQKAFRPVDKNKRKLVVSTNICETGVTIEDVDLVIDTCLVKSLLWNEVTETSKLQLHICSYAEALQRRGRAGRVRMGKCIHLFPRKRMDPEFDGEPGHMRKMPEPEMKRAPLTACILSLTDQGLEPQLLLNAPGNTITQAKLSNATQTLVELGAIVEHIHDTSDTQSSVTNHSEDRMNTAPRHYTPTTLGRKLSTLPCDARNGKTLLAAYQLGCLKSAAVFIASLDSKTFIDKSRRHTVEFYRVKFGKKTDSDAALVINVYSEWKKVERIDRKEWCKVNGLSYATLNQLSGVADDLLASVNIPGFDTAIEPSGQKCQTCKTNIGMHTCVTDGSKELLHAAIVAGVGSNIAFRATPEGSESPMFLTGNKSSTFCGIHRSSLVSTPGEYIVYCSQMINQSGKQSLLTIATISIGTILLFSNWSKYFIGDGTVIVGRGIGFRCRQDTLLSLRKLRVAWEDSLVDGTSLGDKADKAELLAILKEILLLGYPQ